MSRQLVRILLTCAAMSAAVYSGSVPAMFIAVIGCALFWQNHTIEVKLNKLLDHHDIFVSKDDIEAG